VPHSLRPKSSPLSQGPAEVRELAAVALQNLAAKRGLTTPGGNVAVRAIRQTGVALPPFEVEWRAIPPRQLAKSIEAALRKADNR
jgi:hypothetical protein